MTEPSVQIAEKLVAEVVSGKLDAARAWLRDHAGRDELETRALSTVLESHLWLAHMNAGTRARVEAFAELAGQSRAADAILRLGLDVAALSFALGFDFNAISKLLELGHELAPHDGFELRLSTLYTWHELLSGRFDDAALRARELAHAGRQCRAPEIVIHATALQALATLGTTDLAGGLELARLTSRMARTEALPQVEYLANLVLARARRLSGAPHLALHILTRLGGYAPPPWHPWLWWERQLAAGSRAAEDTLSHPLPGLDAPRALSRCLSLVNDRHGALEASVATLLSRVEKLRPLLTDASDLLYGLGLPVQPASPEVEQWSLGKTHPVPRGLHGPGIRQHVLGELEPSVAFVVHTSDGRARRVLEAGLALYPDARILDTGDKRQLRVETLLCVLLLAGERLDQTSCFLRVYGFAFDAQLHQGMWDVLIHRARQALGDAGNLVRQEQLLHAELNQTLAVPDPRIQWPLEDRMLRLFANEGAQSAKHLAERLAVSVRTVQHALKELLDTGACVQERTGRSFKYRVEDTTFAEPTHASGSVPPKA